MCRSIKPLVEDDRGDGGGTPETKMNPRRGGRLPSPRCSGRVQDSESGTLLDGAKVAIVMEQADIVLDGGVGDLAVYAVSL